MSIEVYHTQYASGTDQESLLADFWRNFTKNRLAVAGLVIFLLFFALSLLGLALTFGPDPVLDPAQIRLQDKLQPPLSRPAKQGLQSSDPQALGIYLLGTDQLG
ncbi:MAG: hypothetical protein ACOC43_12485, partial [Desulfohalobiaceae bacterium]